MSAHPSAMLGDGASRPPVPPAAAAAVRHAMTVDVEEYFQVSAFEGCIPRATWERWPSRVEPATARLLDLFAASGAGATFFTLGWVAERHRALVRRIVAEGHELASHGFDHRRVRDQDEAAFRADVRRTKALLEDVAGVAVRGYRAASFSIGRETPWAHRVLAEEGYAYSSSLHPIRHDHYGDPDAPRVPHERDGVLEVPVATLRLLGRNLPCAGGGHFRLLPYAWTRFALARATGLRCRVFYLHPWEIDPDQPRVPGAPLKARLRHRVNLGRTEPRLRRLLRDFAWGRLDRLILEAPDGDPAGV